MNLEAVIGLEIHAQLATESKLFCSCSTAFGQPPNQNTCPICLGLPGVLPTLNARAVELAVRLGLATHCTVHLYSEFARKNYFYPDLPKGYQISQYDRPLCEHGWVEFPFPVEPASRRDSTQANPRKRIRITRIHLEEDAGKLIHEGRDPHASYVDLNRAGMPLVEIVSEPDLRSAEEARAYMEYIHALVVRLGASHGNMEQGNLRADANISLRPCETERLGIRTETKNINSFRFVQQALRYEIERQSALLESGAKVIQETRLYDTARRETRPMRQKEEAHDYRYFPDPDLLPLRLDAKWVEGLRGSLVELPEEQAQRYEKNYGLSAYDAQVLSATPERGAFFEATVAAGASPKPAANWITGPLSEHLNEEKSSLAALRFDAAALAELIRMVEQGRLSHSMGRKIFETLYNEGGSPQRIADAQGLSQLSDEAELRATVQKMILDHPQQVEQFRAGKDRVLGFFVGQVMRATQGQANPALVSRLLHEELGTGKTH